jgi:hypothetical protein
MPAAGTPRLHRDVEVQDLSVDAELGVERDRRVAAVVDLDEARCAREKDLRCITPYGVMYGWIT